MEDNSRIIEYSPKGVCCKLMKVKLNGDTIEDVQFFGGCNGNLSGIRNLVRGQNVDDVIDRLKGIPCGAKSTSCPDQFALCLEEEKAKSAGRVVY